ncbi:MAG: ADP-heptose:LPS heptosyltransferase [Psychromonas sp.]|jgi:ADP-heptose:LPS heptosyltransferase
MIIFLKNKLRNFDKIRRQKMHSLEGILYRLIKNDSELETELIPNDQVKRVLIMRNNKRIGNVLFLITFVRQVRLAYPNAKIDLLLVMPWQGQFFNGLEIDNIYYSHVSFFGIAKWLAMIKQLNQLQLDLILAPSCSASDAITTAMLTSKNKVSSYNQNRILAFPHSVKTSISPLRSHAAYRGLSLLEKLGHKLVLPFNHNLAFSEDEINHGRALSRQYLTRDDAVNLVFFRGARGVKSLKPKVWETILAKFEASIDRKINWIEVLSPDITTPLRANIATFETKNMRLLGTWLKNFDGFVCCDTGPLHLADASEVKCIGLFTHTNIEVFGLLGETSVHITDINNFEASGINLNTLA